MSEQQTHNPYEHLPPPPMETHAIQEPNPLEARLTGDAGAISFGEIAQKTGDILSISYDRLQLAYHGVAGAIREKRTGYAENREDKMDHKDLLYDHLGIEAQGRTSGILEPLLDAKGAPVLDAANNVVLAEPKPRSRVERFMDKRLEKKGYKRAYKKARDNFTTQAYSGNKESNTLGRKTRKDTRRRRADAVRSYDRGEIGPHTLRETKKRIKGTPLQFENSMQRKSRKKLTRATNSLMDAADQPILSRWRSRRRYEARNDQAHHHKQEQKHRTRAAAIRTKRGW